jgi:hypothetical protein
MAGFFDQCHSLLICFRTAFLFHLGSWLSIDQQFFQAWNYTPANDWFFSNDSFPILSKYPSVLNVFHVISCYFMLIHVMDIYGWFLHRYFSSFLVSNQIRFVHIKRVSAAPEDSRNGMIWIFDMPSGTCTSALSCHSQQVRQRMAVAAFQLYGVILYPNIIEYNVDINRSI